MTGDAVVEARAEGDEQVGLLQRANRRDGAVHARHAQVQRVRVGEGPTRHQGGDDRDAGQLGEAQQFRRRASPLMTPPPT